MVIFDFENLNRDLTQKLLSFELPEKEQQYRLARLNMAYNESMANGLISTTYYNIAHEVKCIALIQTLGDITLPRESKSELGPDLSYKNYYIECVCCSLGNKEINGLKNYIGEGTFDYRKKRNKLLTRITSSLESKVEYPTLLIKKGYSLRPNYKYIVFLGLGEVRMYLRREPYGFEMNAVLFGEGDLTVSYDLGAGNIKSVEREYISTIENHNSSKVNVNLFLTRRYKPVSAVVYTNAGLYDDYTIYNTFVFTNPNANKNIKLRDFSNMYYWSIGRSGLYTVKKNYKKIYIRSKRIY